MSRRGPVLWLALVVAAGLLYYLERTVPFSDGEFVAYHNLGCSYYPLNRLNTFREACGGFDLAPVPGKYLPLRSFVYAGDVHDLLYLPLFLLWRSPHSARLLGVLMLAVQAWLVYRMFGVRFVSAFLLLLTAMPYALLHVADVGPLSFDTTSVFAVCYLAQRWMAAVKNGRPRAWRYPLTIGLTIFLGVWAKLSYFSMLPGTLMLVGYFIVTERALFRVPEKRKMLVRHLAVLVLVASVLSIGLLQSVQRDGHRYFQVMARTRRKVLFIGARHTGSDWHLIKKSFPDLARLRTDFDTGTWRVWTQR